MIRAFLDFGEWYYRVGLVGVPSHGSGYSRRERPREKIYLSNPTGSPGNLGRTLGLLGRDIAGAQVAKVEARIRRAEETIEELRPLLNKPFSGKKDLAEARKEFARLTDLFNTYTPETGSQDETERPDRQPPPPDDVPIEEVGPMVQHNPHALSVLLVEWEGLPEGTVVFVRDNREQAGHVDVVVIAQKGAGDHGQFSVITAEGTRARRSPTGSRRAPGGGIRVRSRGDGDQRGAPRQRDPHLRQPVEAGGRGLRSSKPGPPHGPCGCAGASGGAALLPAD